MSSAAADPNSPSLDFRTKYEGEEVVRKAFPNVTILRPCLMYGINDHFASIVQRQSVFFFHKFIPVYDDLTTLKQPIREHDVSLAILNALKLHETRVSSSNNKGKNLRTWWSSSVNNNVNA